MTDDAILVLKTLFETIWMFFTSWYIPGTNVTPAAMFLFLGAAGIGLRFVGRFLDIGGGASLSGAARSRNTAAEYHNRGTGRSVSK